MADLWRNFGINEARTGKQVANIMTHIIIIIIIIITVCSSCLACVIPVDFW
jgi:hypothetical protein